MVFMKNMVDERFEVCALIFRFIPPCGFTETYTDYHRELNERFNMFAEHPAIEYAKSLKIGYDAVSKFAVHMEKKDGKFLMIGDLQSLTDCGRWNEERIVTFIKLLNDFYKDTQYELFYKSNISFYEEETQKFIEQELKKINFGWFEKYLDIANVKCIHSPSLFNANYGAMVSNKYTYFIVPHNAAIVHEICHSFANPIASGLYNENVEFKKLCDDTAVISKIPWYKQGVTFAYEYIARAYNILYDFQQGEKNIDKLYARERDAEVENGFPYIRHVYKMVEQLENERRPK